MDTLNIISTANIAFATAIGVASAIGTFLSNFGLTEGRIILGISIYILVILLFNVVLKWSLR